ncbi:MAG: bifunctional 4-hydroxy-2-oxoglutarate aldolase/2-dehydro-3-deoxy-phosphogluconate aldolase [Oscillospiraceae bacterium]
MKCDEVKALILREKLVIIARKVPADKLGRVAAALVKGGIKLLEVTFDQTAADPAADYAACIGAIREAVGDALTLGAGTVQTPAQVDAAHAAGALYIISPGTNPAVVKRTKALGLVSIPGAMTPTEIGAAWEMGADIVKLFPADDLGMHYIWNIRGPLPHIPLMATGGVNPQTIPEFLSRGIAGVGTGVTVIRRDLLDNDDYEGIAKLAAEHVAAVKSA